MHDLTEWLIINKVDYKKIVVKFFSSFFYFQMTGILTLASAVGQAMKAPKLDRLPRSFRVRTYI